MGNKNATAIRAIETHYNGYRFRSRLEARWAVFFDTLGIEYEYEPEGFEFEGGTRYLPDFWLPQVSRWAEVKPKQFDTKEFDLCRKLADKTLNECILIDSSPQPHEYFEIGSCGDKYTNYLDFLKHRKSGGNCGVALVTEYLENEKRFFYCSEYDHNTSAFDGLCGLTGTTNYTDAIIAARSARFEFGENGNGHK